MKNDEWKEVSWKQVYNAIETQKKRLKNKAAKQGLYENFGQIEVEKLKEKFSYSTRVYGSQKDRDNMKLIDLFNDWCMSYNG